MRLRHNVNYVKAMTADVGPIYDAHIVFEAQKSWNLFKDFFIPRRYYNQLDIIAKVMY